MNLRGKDRSHSISEVCRVWRLKTWRTPNGLLSSKSKMSFTFQLMMPKSLDVRWGRDADWVASSVIPPCHIVWVLGRGVHRQMHFVSVSQAMIYDAGPLASRWWEKFNLWHRQSCWSPQKNSGRPHLWIGRCICASEYSYNILCQITHLPKNEAKHCLAKVACPQDFQLIRWPG